MNLPLLLFIVMSIAKFSFSSVQPHLANGHTKSFPECDSIPPLNKGVLDFVNAHIHKKVGRGECWDVAAEALNSVQANWDQRYAFGTKVDYKKECIYPGDIIQFENVKVVIKEGTTTDTGVYPHHTAIIYEVKGKGKYTLAHQNTPFSGKRVGLSELDLANVVKGKITIYRPAI